MKLFGVMRCSFGSFSLMSSSLAQIPAAASLINANNQKYTWLHLNFRGLAAQAQARVQGPPAQDASLIFAGLFDQEARTQLTPAAIVNQLDRFIVVCGHCIRFVGPAALSAG